MQQPQQPSPPVTTLNNLPPIITSRSQHATNVRCSRRGLYEYYWPTTTDPAGPKGLTVRAPNLEPLIGTCVHKGAAMLLTAAATNLDETIKRAYLPTVIKACTDLFDTRCNEYTQTLQEIPEWLSYSIKEGRAFVEALLALFFYHPSGLNMILNSGEVVAVEQEVEFILRPSDTISGIAKSIYPVVFKSTPDIVIREASSGQLFSIDINDLS